MNDIDKRYHGVGRIGIGLFIFCMLSSAAIAQTRNEPIAMMMAAVQDHESAETLRIKKTPVHVQWPQPLSKSTAAPKITAPLGGLVTIMSENFEGTFPSGAWQVGAGNHTWAKRNCVAYGGSFSAWAVGGGTLGNALSCGANYPNSTSTVMAYGPFDLSDANWAAFTFFVSLNLESDYLDFLASEDGNNFDGYRLSGTTNGGWIPFTFALTAVPGTSAYKNLTGKPAVWIAFAFSSDATGNLPNGAFVDDVVLQKGMINVPTLISSFSAPGPSTRGLAFDGANLWCSDATNDQIYKLSTAGSVISSFSSPGSLPTGLAWDGMNLWNADANAMLVYKLSTTGTVLNSFSTPGTYGTGLCWEGSAFWYSDLNAPTIWQLDNNGGILSSFSASGTYHYGLAHDGKNLWLVDVESLLIYKMDTNGNILDYSLVPATYPSGLAWDGNYLWLADRDTDLLYQLQVATQQFANDVGVTAMNLPNTLKFGDSLAISVVVKNFGTAAQSDFPVKYSINNGPAVTENFAGTLAAGATATKNFAAAWKPRTEGTYRFTAATALAGDENAANDNLPAPKEVVVSSSSATELFFEDFEKYPTGVLGDAPGTQWVRLSTGRNGNVTTTWVHGGQQNFEINSFLYTTEVDYAKFNVDKKPDQLNVELWYTPDGFYVYKDFAGVGLAYVASPSDMTRKVSFWGSDHNVMFQASSMPAAVNVFTELEYGGGPAPSGTPQHNYIRVEFDFIKNQARFFIGPTAEAPQRATVNFDANFDFNAIFIAGGLNPTFIDDIRITAQSIPQFARDIGVTDMDLPNTVNVNTTVPVGVVIKNFGTAEQSNFPVSYRLNNEPAVTENFSGTLAPGASATKTFTTPWTPAVVGTYRFTAWTALTGDENVANDTLPTPKEVVVRSGGTNTPPVLAEIGNQLVTAGETRNVQLSATDLDGDALTFSILANPGFLSISNFSQTGNVATATLVMSPLLIVQGIFNASVQVSDGKGGVDSEDFTVEVIPPSKGAWSYQNPMNGYRQFNGIHFIDAQTGWVVGASGTIRKTTDGGLTWQAQSSGTTFELDDVHFVNSQTGWAVGASISSSNPQAPILKTIDGGTTWISQSTPAAHRLWSVHFVNDQTGWAVGIDKDLKDMIIKTTDGGATWNVMKSETSSNETYHAVYFVDAQTGWVVGWNSGSPTVILKTTDGGTTWNLQTATTNAGLNAVQFLDTQTGWAVGASGTVLRTTDGGTTWTKQTSGTTNTLESVCFIDAQRGWAVGSSDYGEFGHIIITADGGLTWTKQNSGASRTSVLDLYAVQFIDPNNGWAVGTSGLVLKTTDGGANWMNLSLVTYDHLYAVYFHDANTGWAGGNWGTLLKTTNAGAKWTPVSVPNARRINDIYFTDAKTGWACQGVGKILKTTNGGVSWTEISTATTRAFLAMYFVDAKTGWAVGGGSVYRVIFKTTDGGDTWTSQNVPNGEALMDVFFINATTGWVVGMNGAILKTTDGGANWVAQNSGRTDWLECVYFKDANVGFVGGSEGILQTTDGGTSWTLTDLAGWVDDLIFVDAQNGFAVGAIGSTLSKGIDGSGDIDVGGGGDKTWQTTDGGETWTEILQSGTKWILRAFFTDRNSGWGVGTLGAIMKYTDALPLPAPPSNLTAEAISQTAIKLAWLDNANNENGFHLYRSAGVSGAFRLLTTLTANTATYTDTALTFGMTYWYRLEAFNAIGNSALSLDAFATAGNVVAVEQDREVPAQFALEQNYPNPFWSAATSRAAGNPATFIIYSLPQPAQVELKVYDVLGHEVRILVNDNKPAGVHRVSFDGQGLPGGLYFYRLRAGEFVETKKMLIVR
jgi:photosystem II stability/assembly factor-like uncharacterized protein